MATAAVVTTHLLGGSIGQQSGGLLHRHVLIVTQQLFCQQHPCVGHNTSSSTTSSSRGFSTATPSHALPAETTPAVVDAVVTTAQQTPPDLGPLFSAGAAALDAVHTATGLPWVAVIPAAAVAVKTLLLPLSLKQAKIVRTNMVLWKEAYEFQKQQQARSKRHQQDYQQQQQVLQQGQASQLPSSQPDHQQQSQQQASGQQFAASAAAAAGGGGGVSSPSALESAAAALQQLQHWQERVQLFHDLRRKCGVPHPAWLLVNGSLQVPLFIYTAASIRRMAQSDWPGFSSEGALWFTDLTQPALQLSHEAGTQLLLPLGLPGLILPLAATGIMLTSIHLGFKASGAAARHPSLSGTWMAAFLTWLRPFLYTITLASAAIKVQLPQAPVLHWLTTASYTLGLQLGLRSPRVRQLLGFSQPGSVDSSRDIDPAVVAQAAAMDNADVLVVMGAKHAALQRYNEAMHCLQRALLLNPNNARAHYSAGQIYALQSQWAQSEQSYRVCVQLQQSATADPASLAQAHYCVGVACHQQGKFAQAVEAYDAAANAGPTDNLRPMLALGSARALVQLGRADEAAAVADSALKSQWVGLCPAAVVDALKEVAAGPVSTLDRGQGSAE